MGIFLNSAAPYSLYESEVKKPYFVDKSLMLKNYFCQQKQEIRIFVSQDQDVLEKL